MVLAVLTVVLMLAVAYAQLREGILTSFVMFINVLIASVVACNFFEPCADAMADMTTGSFMQGVEDFVILVALFALTLAGLRWLTNNLATTEIEYNATLLRGGAIFFGLVTGYVLSGFFVVALQTLPLHENFMGFEAEITTDPSYAYLHRTGAAAGKTAGQKSTGEGLRRFLPPDRIWLAMMQSDSYGSLGRFTKKDEKKGFDPNCNFQLRYERYRRYGTAARKPDALPYDDVLWPANRTTGAP